MRPTAITGLTLALASTALVATAPTASAAENFTTVVTLSAEVNTPGRGDTIRYGERIDLYSNVYRSGSTQWVHPGTIQLQKSVRGGPWKNVGAPTESAGFESFDDVRVSEKTAFRAVYSGGTDYQGNYQPSSSKAVTIRVARKITFKGNNRTFKVTGKITPDYKRKPVTVKFRKSAKGKFRTHTKVRTNAQGRYSLRLPKKKGYYEWRFIVKGDKRFVSTWHSATTTVY